MIPPKQIGWGVEENLLWQISKQLENLTNVTYNSRNSPLNFLNYSAQSSNPPTPTSGFNLFANSSGLFSWKGTNGFVRTFDGTANTADRMYTLPNNNGTIALLESTQTFSGVNTFTNSLTVVKNLFASGNGSVNVQVGQNTDTGNGNFAGIWINQLSTNRTVTNYAFLSDAINGNIFNSTVGFLDFRIANSSKIRIHNNGNFSIGTTTDAGYKLDVNGTGRISSNLLVGSSITPNNFSLNINSGGNGSYIHITDSITGVTSADGFIIGVTATQEATLLNREATAMTFRTTDLERMRITAGGNVLINTTTDAGYKLDVAGTGRFSSQLTVLGSSSSQPALLANGFGITSNLGRTPAPGNGIALSIDGGFQNTDGGTAASTTVSIANVARIQQTILNAINTNVTYTVGTTLRIEGAPNAGTNVTITNPYALYVNSGQSFFGGNVTLGVAGNKLNIATGTNASIGTATLVAGTVTVSTTAVTTNSKIMLSYNTPIGTLGVVIAAPSASIVNGVSFVINSLTSANTVLTTDLSTINWWIIN
jgi:hypothetical protein